MKKHIPTVISLLFLFLYIYSNFSRQIPESEFDLDLLGQTPVVMNGRIQPIDSVARNTLLAMSGKRSARYEDGSRHKAIEWMADLLFEPDRAATRPVFRIHDDGLKALLPRKDPEQRESMIGALLLGSGSSHHYYSFEELREFTPKISADADAASQIDGKLRTRYQKAVINLASNVLNFYSLSRTVHHGQTPSFVQELEEMQELIPEAIAATRQRLQGEVADEQGMQAMAGIMRVYQQFESEALFFTHPKPPVDGEEQWDKMSIAFDEIALQGQPSAITLHWATLNDAYRNNDPQAFNETLPRLHRAILEQRPEAMSISQAEVQFNYLEPFYVAIVGYVMVSLLAIFSWPTGSLSLNRAAFWTLVAVFAIHTIGMGYRVYIIGYAPVINLYSSAIYVGWGATLLALVVERIFQNGIGSFVASVVGVCSLIVAHHLIDGRDTLEQMKAVLDSNFWLTVHVLTITFGYASTFFAGFVGIVYGVFSIATKWVSKEIERMLTAVVYGIICFSTLFSFFGTVSGGIWADQSWGRFWGWDPKENGAVLLVIWNVMILHARWGGFAKTRGVMAMAIFGNIITSWSWMGTNMLGIGLHSYGFTSAAFTYLGGFWLSQLFFIALLYLPKQFWRSQIRA